jgi:hypothetical protein
MLLRVVVSLLYSVAAAQEAGQKAQAAHQHFIVIISSHSWPMQMVQNYWSSTKTMFGPASEKPAK